jgi:hypothetical protein
MERRAFVAGAGTLLLAGCAPRLPAADDAAAVKQTIADYYAAYRSFDKQRYRALLDEAGVRRLV